MAADLASLDMTDDNDIRAEKSKIEQAKRRYGV
jgi:hypothetical protein